MPLKTGSLSISDLREVRFKSAVEYGLDKINDTLQADLGIHNGLMQDMLSELTDITTDRQRLYGGAVTGSMFEVDEFGRGPTQKDSTGATVAFPLRKFQFPIGWTDMYFKLKTPADLVETQIAAEKAHIARIRAEIQRAFFTPTNYTFRDFLVDKVSLAVKALINADSSIIPPGPNGEVFDGTTHTHYDFVNGLTAAAATALVKDVLEHGHGGKVRVVINQADETAWRALAGFTPYADPRIVYGATDHAKETVDVTRMDNRPIGIFSSAEVWVKPWGLQNYAIAYDLEGDRPLAFRQREQTSLQGLRIAAELDTYPMHAKYMEAEFGIGVWNRTNGAVLYFAAGAASYVAPTIVVP